jgi:hypothetical protein
MKNQSKQVIETLSPFGSMAVSARNERVKNTVTSALVLTGATDFALVTSEPIVNPGLYPNGRHVDISISGDLGSLYPSGIPAIYQNFDQFRLKHVEFFCSTGISVGAAIQPMTILASVDEDDALPTSFDVFRSRKNVAMTTLTQTQPVRTVASFHPRANYAVSVNTSSPSNALPNKNAWFDTSATSQQFLGLKLHAAVQTNTTATLSVFARVTVEFRAQV